MAEDKSKKPYVDIKVIGPNYDSNVYKKTISDSIHKSLRVRTLNDVGMGCRSKQQKGIDTLSEETEGPQMG